MILSRADFEASLARLREEVTEPRFGVFGPRSASWQLNREAINFLGGGRAALLQLAHPYVAYGVDEHSAARTDPFARFTRTFEAIFAMAFGDLDSAIKAARRVFAIHTRVRGSLGESGGKYRAGDHYHANHDGALAWVHATLTDTVIQVRTLCGLPMGAQLCERYYQESRRFARLFAIPEDDLPADYLAFRRYMDRMLLSEALVVTRPAKRLADFLLAAPSAPLAPFAAWYRMMTAGLLPERLREGFGLAFSGRERAAYRASARALRAAYPRLPVLVRTVPAYWRATERVAPEAGGVLTRAVRRRAAAGLGFWPRLGLG